MARHEPERHAKKHGRYEQIHHLRLERTSKGEGQSACPHRQALEVVKRREGEGLGPTSTSTAAERQLFLEVGETCKEQSEKENAASVQWKIKGGAARRRPATQMTLGLAVAKKKIRSNAEYEQHGSQTNVRRYDMTTIQLAAFEGSRPLA